MSKQPLTSLSDISIEPIEPAPQPVQVASEEASIIPVGSISRAEVQTDLRKPIYAKIPIQTVERLELAMFQRRMKVQDVVDIALKEWLSKNGY